MIPITVTSRGSDPLARDLAPADFRVYEDGVAQTVTLVDRDRRPLSLCIVLDSSDSMRGQPKPVILVVSDGEETGSVTPFSQLVSTRRVGWSLVRCAR